MIGAEIAEIGADVGTGLGAGAEIGGGGGKGRGAGKNTTGTAEIAQTIDTDEPRAMDSIIGVSRRTISLTIAKKAS